MRNCKNIIMSIDKIMRKSISEQTLRNLLTYIFIGSLIPLFFIAKYNFPSVDDFSNGMATKNIWQESNNIFLLIKQAAIHAYQSYFSWDGRFVACFLFALNPIIFGEKFYIFVPIIIISIFIASNLFFLYVVFGKIFQANSKQWGMVALVELFLSIQFLPSAVQGFYWYTGAVLYTVIYSISLFLYGIIILLIINEEEISNKKRIMYGCLISLLSFFIGGAEYVSAIRTFFVYLIIIVFQIIRRCNYKIYIFPYILFLISFAMNILAPGNQVRGEGKMSTGLIRPIYLMIVYAIEKLNYWLNLPMILLCICSIPIFINIIRKSKCKFRFPIIISIISFALYGIQFFPHAYALSSIGPDRLLNVIYFTFIFLVLFNLFYWLGWLYQKNIRVIKGSDHSRYTICIIGVLLLLCFVGLKAEFPSTSVAAVYSIVIGESQNYHKENQERLSLLKDESQKNVVLKAHKYKPMILFWDDGDEEPKNWRNEAMAGFYGKETVIVKD